ncbi:hypothetical protein HS088_TW04G01383 [Tripterygium wilfordii]|uniref:Uncharacterized protein n=1 Tax=Tripterygium wilfordii TaxID=458696 RepID=A0A7J7DTD8_TRIWF|nr:hypothetical protein HS088_TW04G01383 [Tripterygium wilfordii]
MEGLIPTIFRAVGKNRTRKQYECLSSGASHMPTGTSTDQNIRSAGFNAERINGHHRRYNSVGDFLVANSSSRIEGKEMAAQKQVVRSRSHRILSCVTGN